MRLRRSLGGLPKPMAEVMGRPFLEWILLRVASFGFRSVVISTGYRRETIRRFFGAGAAGGVAVRCVEEESPLGTAGALKNALRAVNTGEMLVLNGDSLCLCDIAGLYRFHLRRGGGATLCCVRVADASRYGAVVLGAGARIASFTEKGAARGGGWVNAGIYWMTRRFVEGIGDRTPLSLEEDVLPRRTGEGLYAYRARGDFIDIGTPESLAGAPDFIRRNGLPALARAAGGIA